MNAILKILGVLIILIAPISGLTVSQSSESVFEAETATVSSTNLAELVGTDVDLTQVVVQSVVCDGDVSIDATNEAEVAATGDATVNQGIISGVMGNNVEQTGANWADVDAGEVALTSQSVTESVAAVGAVDQTAGNILFSDAGLLAQMNGQLVQMSAIGGFVEQNGGNLLWSTAPEGQVGQTAILGAVSETDAIQNADNWALVCMDNAYVGQGAFIAGEASGDLLYQDAANLALVFGDDPVVGQYIAGQGVSGDVLVQFLDNDAAFIGDGGVLAQHTETVAFGNEVYQYINNNWT